MIRKLKQQLKSGTPVKLTITKRTQMYGKFLTSRHPLSQYPILEDKDTHLNKGDVVRVIMLGQLPGCVPSVLVQTPSGRHTHIFLKELSKYTKF